jgi:hypothetical protein
MINEGQKWVSDKRNGGAKHQQYDEGSVSYESQESGNQETIPRKKRIMMMTQRMNAEKEQSKRCILKCLPEGK